MTLRALQAAAAREGSEAPMTWTALARAGQNFGAPAIDYDRFAARWETDPILKQLVDRFDGAGIVVKTNNQEQPMQGAPKAQNSNIDSMAKRASDKSFK
jgi:hypothetical protein